MWLDVVVMIDMMILFLRIFKNNRDIEDYFVYFLEGVLEEFLVFLESYCRSVFNLFVWLVELGLILRMLFIFRFFWKYFMIW